MGLWLLFYEKLKRPFDVHMVRYEDLVADLEGESRPIMDYLGLAWDEKSTCFS